MDFLKNTADLLTFNVISDEMDKRDEKMNGGISVYSNIMDRQVGITGGSSSMLPLGTLKDTYIPIGLYLDERLPKNEVVFSCSDSGYDVIGDDLYEKLLNNISLRKKYSAGKTIKLKTMCKKVGDNISNKTAKKI